MSSIMKVLLALAAVVCIAKAHFRESGSQCLCQSLSMSPRMKSEIKDIQIYPATIFCNNVEILVTTNSGSRYCLNPKLKAMKRFLSTIIAKQKLATARPTVQFSTSLSSTNTAII
ncbi:C-X-C motif chemokine 10-like [Antennarius striatus]|uniref:C-X-C motif chemokine 10-like n=1 Tax=Antennarius striatus TaxID=241820 RepID=UPI0035B4D432